MAVFAEVDGLLAGSAFRGCKFISAAAAKAMRTAVVALLDAAIPPKRRRRAP
jgi:hypothetical protein